MNAFGGMARMSAFSTASLFSYYASITAFITLIKQFYYQFVPEQLRVYISKRLEEWSNKPREPPPVFTVVIEEREDGDYEGYYNHVYRACEAYLARKLQSTARRLKASRTSRKDSISLKLAEGEAYTEEFEGVKVKWCYVCDDASDSNGSEEATKHFQLSCDPDHRDKVIGSYLPSIVKFCDDMTEEKKELRLYSCEGYGSSCWKSVKFDHPFTLDALALDPDLKRAVIDDVNRFMKRKEFYKKIGRAWKRGYLLYGPPGTGKSSLIAAMANYLKFDIYDLQLSSALSDSSLRRLLLSTTNKSVLVIEDIDCSSGSAVCRRPDGKEKHDNSSDSDIDKDSRAQISLSGLLNFIDGLWSSCGDERIIIFTTNHRDKLDPALLRPGRMDMHIHMSYLTMPAFRILASNYLNITGEHPLFGEIKQLLQATNVTPAQAAEELLRSDDADVALCKLIDMLKAKINSDQNNDQETDRETEVGNGKDENVQDGSVGDEVDVVNEELSSD